MNRDNMNLLTVAELREYARNELKMTGISKLKKADLIEKMIEAETKINSPKSQLIKDTAEKQGLDVVDVPVADGVIVDGLPTEKSNPTEANKPDVHEQETRLPIPPRQLNRAQRRAKAAIERGKAKRAAKLISA